MNLNYEKIREKVEHGGNHWTSYSDLFLVLSVVFLLLYVVANLKNGTGAIATATQLKAARTETEELRKQIQAYEVLKESYLQQGASKDEVQVYQELMGKLDLLEGEAKKESNDLLNKAQQAKAKHQELNHYQQLVKNIISANLVAQSRVKKRETIIEEKQGLIAIQERNIGDLTQTIGAREKEIRYNNDKISEIEGQLTRKIKEVRKAYSDNKTSEKNMQEKIQKLRTASYTQISRLKNDNSKFVNQLELTQSELAEKNRQAERLLNELGQKELLYRTNLVQLTRSHESQINQEKAAFRNKLEKEKLTAEARLQQEHAHLASIESQNAKYQNSLSALNGDLEATRKSIREMEGKYQTSLSSLQKANLSLQQNLTASQNKLNEQKILAERIRKNFAKSGIGAETDQKTGDVIIQFQNEYFDTDRSELKAGMRSTLEKLMPVYAKSLLQDEGVAKRISSVEIVGFASPTYQGRFIDPASLDSANRAAVNYNMDLSYQRAKSIFEYVFDSGKMTFENQKRLLPLIKVSGRSYLATDKIAGRNLSAAKGSNYCHVYDCKKSQRVIIKFNLRDE